MYRSLKSSCELTLDLKHSTQYLLLPFLKYAKRNRTDNLFLWVNSNPLHSDKIRFPLDFSQGFFRALAASHVLYNRTEQQSRLLYKCHLNRRALMITGSPTTCAMMMTRTDTKSKGVCLDRTWLRVKRDREETCFSCQVLVVWSVRRLMTQTV